MNKKSLTRVSGFPRFGEILWWHILCNVSNGTQRFLYHGPSCVDIGTSVCRPTTDEIYRTGIYSDVIISAMPSQITCVSIVCSTVCSGADQRKHQSSVSLTIVIGIHRSHVDSTHKGPVHGNCFHLVTSSYINDFIYIQQWYSNVLACFKHWARATSLNFDEIACWIKYINISADNITITRRPDNIALPRSEYNSLYWY